MSSAAGHSSILDDLVADDRWQLVQRIVSSPPFQKSGRLRDLLLYITEQSIHGFAHELTEQHIGEAVFHKATGYSPLEDSSVRVHARQLRLKLHEYFDGAGRDETLIVEIPKGAYAPIFRPGKAQPPSALPGKIEPVATRFRSATMPWALCGALAMVCVTLLFLLHFDHPANAPAASPAWPFSQIFDTRHKTVVVVADGNYGMWRILTGQKGSLEQYLNRDLPQKSTMLKFGEAGARFSDYISNSTLTSFADVADAVSLVKAAGPLQNRASVRSARDLEIRDLDHENYVLVGSPASNPWVSLFEDKLNFRESEEAVGKSAKVFVNAHPLPGELAQYEGLQWTGTEGDDYATIALVPNMTRDGSVLILQGLQQEGTEAAGRFLLEAENRHQLQRSLGIPLSDSIAGNIWFEALIRSRAVSGAPNSTTLVSVRRIQ
jgi:hypothetical protein